MIKKVAKIAILIIITAGVIFSIFNFVSIKSEAGVIWQKLDEGVDPYLGTPYIRCYETGQACISVSPYVN